LVTGLAVEVVRRFEVTVGAHEARAWAMARS
jgi:hypothetical protein